MVMVRAGQRNVLVHIEEGVTGKDGYGGNTLEWVRAGSAWASVNDSGGNLGVASKEGGGEFINNRVDVRILYRMLPEVFRLVQERGGRVLTPIAVGNPEGRNREVFIKCTTPPRTPL